MPVINDAMVVNQPYDTSSNGGRKLVSTKNGKMFAVVKKSPGIEVYETSNNWVTKSVIYNSSDSIASDACLVANGNDVYMLYATNGWVYVYSFANGKNYTVEGFSQAALGNVSLAINEAGTELHAAWASKNSSFPSSFNIRYAKGTINADGSVAWGAVEQWTARNTAGFDFKNPNVIIVNSKPIVICDFNTNGSFYYIYALSSSGLPIPPGTDILKTYSQIYSVGSYLTQSSPSAIFVPQSINGLANGRIELTWGGMDSTDSSVYNLRYAYSDDGGITWTVQKLTTGNQYQNGLYPTIAANKSNEIFILFQGTSISTSINDYRIKQIKKTGSSWGSVVEKKTFRSESPSSLFDQTMSFSEPLFIYKDVTNAKVGFYGSWTVINSSVPSGSIGQKTDKSNILTYSITTDGTMSTITEKINGVTVGTKTATSGQSLSVSLTQAQWDAVKYGKYATGTGGLNTLTIEMGTEKWTYTFDKQLASNADLLSTAKASMDAATVSEPAKKALFAGAVRSKGGTVNDGDSWETIKAAVDGIVIPKKASGINYPSSGRLLITGLGFTPKHITIIYSTGIFTAFDYDFNSAGVYAASALNNAYYQGFDSNYYVRFGTFSLPISNGGANINSPIRWFASE